MPQVSLSSMADIAFLLLIYFMVTSTLKQDYVVPQVLPSKSEKIEEDQAPRNKLEITVKESGKILFNDENIEIGQVTTFLKNRLENKSNKPEFPTSVKEAVVLLYTDDKVSFQLYMRVLDAIYKAYYLMRSELLDMSLEEYLRFQQSKVKEKTKLFEKAKSEIPIRLVEK